ncbi:WD40 repeat domain-containing serine/threonine protein kinase [Streptosporangium canum]|uniref:WD40 repeat domain-containing serine/threonine protein kinase n=2 Tax=Streptosporangium canum TaxID=324952 RepID=UPI00344A3017
MTESGGELIGGRYRLFEPVGIGGMGRVWRGRDELLDREVAIKEILFPRGMDTAQRELFGRRAIREARSAARLNHPGIITVYDVIPHDEAPVIVMEFVRGLSLQQQITQQERLAPAQVARIGAMMLEALGEAHAAGVVHRDLKPANVLLTGNRVVITDFGIASLAGDVTLTASGVLIGTPAFMAPEQANGGPVTPACDLWSLGATLYAAVEGRPPYAGTNLMAILAALLSQEPAPPVHAGPLAPVLTGLLRKNPAERFSAEQAGRALTAIAHQPPPDPHLNPPLAPSPPPPAAGQRLPRRRVLLLAGLSALTAIGVPVTIALTHTTDPTPSATFTGHTGRVYSVAFSPDGKTLATGAEDAMVRLWDVVGRQSVATLTGHTASVVSVAFSPDGKTLATGSSDDTVRLWDIADRKTVATLTGHTAGVYSVAFSPDGKTLATGAEDAMVRLWDVADRQSVATLTGHPASVVSVAFSPDGKTLATGSFDNTVRLWDIADRKTVATLTGHTGYVYSVAFSPDGKTLAIGSHDDTVRLWNVAGRLAVATLTGHTAGVWSVAFSPDGKTLATGSFDNTVRLWDIADRKTVATLTGHTAGVYSVAFSPDGKTLATGSSDDHSVKLWPTR